MKSSSRHSVSVSAELPISCINCTNTDYTQSVGFAFSAGDSHESVEIKFEDAASLQEFMRVMTLVVNEYHNQPTENYISRYASE